MHLKFASGFTLTWVSSWCKLLKRFVVGRLNTLVKFDRVLYLAALLGGVYPLFVGLFSTLYTGPASIVPSLSDALLHLRGGKEQF